MLAPSLRAAPVLRSSIRPLCSAARGLPLRQATYGSQLYAQRRAASTLLKLNTGQNIPAIGFGTWQDADAQEGAVRAALDAGYRHIDTARV